MLLRRLILVLFAAPAVLYAPLCAQMHKVEAPERVTRALAVYEWTGDMAKPTASRVVPVSLFIDSHFEDAGVYLARPVPFALESGDVYEVQTSGQPVGTLDLDVARNIVARRSPADDDPLGAWYGYGRFQPPAPEKPAAKLHVSVHPSHINGAGDESDDTPHFVVRHPGDAPAAKTPAGSTPDSKPDTADSSTTTTSTTDTDSDKPTLRHRDPKEEAKRKKEKPQGYVTGPADSLNDDPDRPTLHRGSAEEAEIPPLAGLPADMHQAVAVSDPANREPHDFTREWESSAEREQILADFEKLARDRVAAYIATNKLEPVAADLVAANAPPMPVAAIPSSTPSAAPPAKAPSTTVERQESAAPVTDATTDANGNPIAPGSGDAPSLLDRTAPTTSSHEAATPAPRPPATVTPAMPTHATAHHRRPAAPTVLALKSEDLRGYELSYGALPTFVYTAESPVAVGGPVYVTLVAQRLPSGELQTALTSVTDATHLDRVPWMRPVDAVDPDWSHRASLLFELRAQTSRQFALYRLVTEQAEQTFVTGVIE